jgi:hypothetical protein
MQCPASRKLVAGVLWAVVAGGAAAEGLQAPEAASLWPSWQARVTLTLTDAPLGGNSRSLRQAAVLGDYYLQSHGTDEGARWRGGFRATSGLVLGHLGATVLPVGQSAARLTLAGDDAVREVDLWPYVGFGYSGLAPRGGFSFSADLGLGLRGWERALGRVDLTPMLQLGVRYTF